MHIRLALPMTLLCVQLGYAAGVCLGGFVLDVVFGWGTKSTLRMQYVLSGYLELDATICMAGTSGGNEDMWTLVTGSCGGAPLLHMSCMLSWNWPVGRRL